MELCSGEGRSTTEYTRLMRWRQAEEKVDEFESLGSTIQSKGQRTREVKKRTHGRLKGKVHKTVVRPAVVYGLETVALIIRQEAELVVAGLKMLRFLVVTKDGLDQKRVQVGCLNKMLQW